VSSGLVPYTLPLAPWDHPVVRFPPDMRLSFMYPCRFDVCGVWDYLTPEGKTTDPICFVTYNREAEVKTNTQRSKWIKGALAASLLIPLLLWLTGCWLFNVAPIAAFTISAQTGQAPLTINFSAVLSSDEDGVIVEYDWDFGDGTSGSGESVSHTFGEAGTFTVVLRVTDDRGDSATNNKTIYVSPAEPDGPTASFTASPTTGTSPVTVWVDASSSSYDDGVISQYRWDWGDGGTGFGRNASHSYFTASTQTYTITLTVNGTDGKTGTATRTITVNGTGGDAGTDRQPGDPSARFDIVSDSNRLAGGSTGVAPYNALFDPEDTEVDDGQALLQIVWSFDDGDSATTPNLVEQWHVYTTDEASEVFSITLLAMDDDANTDTITKTLKVYNHQPVAGFEVCNPAGGHTAVDDDEEYATRAAAVAADRWDDDDDDNGIILGDLQNIQTGSKVLVWIRSMLVDESNQHTAGDTDMQDNWLNLAVPQTQVGADWFDDQDDLQMAEGVLAAPGTTKPAPNDYGTDNAFSYDPEGQSWADRSLGANNQAGAADGDTSNDYPDWFPNQGWGIRFIYVDWDDGTGEEQFDYRAETDAGGWAGGTTVPDYDQDFIVSHEYDFPGGTVIKTITIRVVDFLGAEDTFSRDIILMEGTEGSDDFDP